MADFFGNDLTSAQGASTEEQFRIPAQLEATRLYHDSQLKQAMLAAKVASDNAEKDRQVRLMALIQDSANRRASDDLLREQMAQRDREFNAGLASQTQIETDRNNILRDQTKRLPPEYFRAAGDQAILEKQDTQAQATQLGKSLDDITAQIQAAEGHSFFNPLGWYSDVYKGLSGRDFTMLPGRLTSRYRGTGAYEGMDLPQLREELARRKAALNAMGFDWAPGTVFKLPGAGTANPFPLASAQASGAGIQSISPMPIPPRGSAPAPTPSMMGVPSTNLPPSASLTPAFTVPVTQPRTNVLPPSRYIVTPSGQVIAGP